MAELKKKLLVVLLLVALCHCEEQTEVQEASTTPCPQEAEKLKQELANELRDESSQEGTTTICPDEELEKSQTEEQRYETEPTEEAATTICPEELKKQQEEATLAQLHRLPLEEKQHQFTHEDNKLSPTDLLEVQKDSALLKLLQNKNELQNRVKRQVQYYMQQPEYNKKGVATASTQLKYNPRGYNVQRVNYQQPLRPVGGTYQNPTNVRYSNNGNLKNYYKMKNGANRRQFPASTTSKSIRTRAPIKKKFRPSPVFP